MIFFQEWFSKNILTLSNDFRTSNASTVGDLPRLNDNSVQVNYTFLSIFYKARLHKKAFRILFGNHWLSFSQFQTPFKCLMKDLFCTWRRRWYLWHENSKNLPTLVSLYFTSKFEFIAFTTSIPFGKDLRAHSFLGVRIRLIPIRRLSSWPRT